MSRRWMLLLVALAPAGFVAPVRAADIERDPIRYGAAPVHNAISNLRQRLEAV